MVRTVITLFKIWLGVTVTSFYLANGPSFIGYLLFWLLSVPILYWCVVIINALLKLVQLRCYQGRDLRVKKHLSYQKCIVP